MTSPKFSDRDRMFYTPYIPIFDDMFYNKAVWELTFSFWPRRCKISNKRIWLQYGYRGEAFWGPQGRTEVHWHDKIEHIIFQLKR